jgi:hypothetical protein
MATLFGWKFEEQQEKENENIQSFSPPEFDDGSAVVGAAGVYGTYLNLDSTFNNEFDLMARYRSMSMQPECEIAIDEIVNESIVSGRKTYPVNIELDYLNFSQLLRDKIGDEFYNILDKLNFKYAGFEIFRKWFIDGRIFYHVLIDTKNPQKGIVELRPIDPFKIKKIRERQKTDNEESVRIGMDEIPINQKFNEYYLYSETGVFNVENDGTNVGGERSNILKIASDSIVYTNSGLLDERRKNVISYLHKAFRPLNQIRMLEDSAIIYRLSRAPSRRVFYVDVGNLPKAKAEQYMHSLMNQYRNKMVYDSKTGQLRDDRKFQAMLEDYWMPRRNGSATTEIDTLQGSEANFTQLDELEFFQRQLFRSLNVPISRMQPESGFSLGRASEISREEYKFLRFIERLRVRFSGLFLDLLKRQLILKNIISLKQWEEIKDEIHFIYDQDSNFNALKNLELLTEKMNVLRDAEEYRGKYFSANYIRKNILALNDDDIERIEEEIEEEKYDQRFAPQEGEPGLGGGFGGLGGPDLGMGGLGGLTPGTPEPTAGGMINDLGGAETPPTTTPTTGEL